MRNLCNQLVFLALLMAFAHGPALAGSLEPPGPPAPTMKDLDDVEPRVAIRNDFVGLTPVVINFPGSYYLAEDIYALPGQHGIEIRAGHVTLDLNGFSVIGNTEVGSLDGINGIDQKNITIRNGTVTSFFEEGIDLTNSPYGTIENVRVLNNALNGGLHFAVRTHTNSRVSDTILAENLWHALHVESNSVISRCIARDNGGTGFQVSLGVLESSAAFNNVLGVDSFQSLVRGNNFSSNTTNVQNAGGTLIDNEIN